MNLLGVELAGFTGLHQLDCVVEYCWPIEPAAKRLADECARRRVVPTVSTVNVCQQLFSLLPGDAMQSNVIQPLSVELSVLDAVGRGLPRHALHVLLLLRQGPLHQVILELHGPTSLLRLQRQEQACP